jgi:hypothetical protein
MGTGVGGGVFRWEGAGGIWREGHGNRVCAGRADWDGIGGMREDEEK